ncbi:prostatic acid phosphatase [Trichinella spiralis]|uniref:prostatic acid phosphatase n=1 Tax=Trichinella spiralis TaxID=6334 RepID=UPI0001EFD09E|nr:prostatic acid phosphatase [Trichinella spiralis]
MEIGNSFLCTCSAPSINKMWRHGARAPLTLFPSEYDQTIQNWPNGLGELTPLGILQQFQLGTFLRQRYEKLIPKYKSDAIYIRSTDSNRTIMSAMANLAGMFPPENSQNILNLTWQPIPIHTIPKTLDKVLDVTYSTCPYPDHVFYSEEMNSETVRAIMEEKAALFDFLRERTVVSCKFLLFTITATRKSPLFVEFFISNPTGPLLQSVAEVLMKKAKRIYNDQLKYMAYSAHETGIIAFFTSMQIYNTSLIPDFAACIMTELYEEEDGTYTVDVNSVQKKLERGSASFGTSVVRNSLQFGNFYQLEQQYSGKRLGKRMRSQEGRKFFRTSATQRSDLFISSADCRHHRIVYFVSDVLSTENIDQIENS